MNTNNTLASRGSRRTVTDAVIGIACVIVSIYLLVQFLQINNDTVEIRLVELVTQYDHTESEGIILRDETVLYSAASGAIRYITGNGEKAALSSAVASVYRSEADVLLISQIEELSKKIALLELSNINLNYSFASKERIENDIDEYYINLIYDIKSNNISSITGYTDDMLVAINKCAVITDSGVDLKKKIETLTAERNALEAELNSHKTDKIQDIFAPVSGIFYSFTDGYENLFTTSSASQISPANIGDWLEKQPESLPSGAVGKILSDYKWYYICKVDSAEARNLKEGGKYDLIFGGQSENRLNMTLESMTDQRGYEYSVLVFSSMVINDGFTLMRKQTARIIYNEVTGLKIPNQALRIVKGEDGTEKIGVYILKRNLVSFKELPDEECLGKYDSFRVYETNEYANLTGKVRVQLYENVIVSDNGVYDGAIIG